MNDNRNIPERERRAAHTETERRSDIGGRAVPRAVPQNAHPAVNRAQYAPPQAVRHTAHTETEMRNTDAGHHRIPPYGRTAPEKGTGIKGKTPALSAPTKEKEKGRRASLPRGIRPARAKKSLPAETSSNEWTKKTRKIRKISLASFAILALALIVLSVNLCYSYSGESIRVISESTEGSRSSSRAYRIVYSESDTFGLSAANALHDEFLEKTGASLEIKSDDESIFQHEIRIGHTNRATDDYLTSASTLGNDGYAVLVTPSDSVNLISFSEAGANAAIKYFMSNYVGAYRRAALTFAQRNNFSYVSRDGDEPDASLRESKLPLSFGENGKFKILVLSDADINPNTVAAISAIAESEKPQLVIFDGDISAGIQTKAELENYITTLTSPLEEKSIPWAVTFGEQDTDAGLSPDAQADVYMTFPCCVMKKEFVSDGIISYFLPIYASKEPDTSSVPVLGVYLMGQNPMLSYAGNGASSEGLFDDEKEAGTDYGYVNANHIAWFARTSEIMEREAGEDFPSIVVTHTPTEEFAICAREMSRTRLTGNVGEAVGASPVNSGLFASLLDCGNVLGLYVGHDHLNTFSARYCGIELAYSGSIGYDGYGLGGTFSLNNSLRGGRLIEFTLRDGKIQSGSRMVYASDIGIGEN